MKKVNILAAAVPAAVALAAPAAAAASGGHGKKVAVPNLFVHQCTATGKSCTLISGPGPNHVYSGLDYSWVDKNGGNRIGYLGYRNNAGVPNKSNWKMKSDSAHAGGLLSYRWFPQCSFPTGAKVSGHVQDHTSRVLLPAIYGSSYNALHHCT